MKRIGAPIAQRIRDAGSLDFRIGKQLMLT